MLFASSSPTDCIRFGDTRSSSLMFMTSHYEKPSSQLAKQNAFLRSLPVSVRFCLGQHFEFHLVIIGVGRWALGVRRFHQHDRSDLFRRGWNALLSDKNSR